MINGSLSFQYEKYSIQEIKKDYYLNNLCVADTPQCENTAITIQSLYFYHDILTNFKGENTIKASMCRTIIIMSYSVIEAIIASLGYKIQRQCSRCKRKNRCSHFSVSMFASEDSEVNERNSFKNANDFLMQTGIINLSSDAKKYYNLFRNSRNNVHLTRNSYLITQDSNYTMESCKQAIIFMQKFIKMLNQNYNEFSHKNNCRMNGDYL